MLYKFNNQNKLTAAIAKFKQKNPAGAVHVFDQDSFLTEKEKFEELLASGKSLFGEKNLIVLREVEAEVGNLDTSETTILLLKSEIEKPAEFNFFSLSNALARRDRAKLWLGYQQALAAGAKPEEVFWRAIWWQVKKMRDAQLSSRLVAIWHDTKREEGRDFGLELERCLLEV